MRVGVTGLDLLAGPALEDDRPGETALRPWRGILEAREVFARAENGGRVELVGGEVPAFARLHVGQPAPRRAKARDREPLGQVLLVVPGVEFLLHRRRRLGERQQQAALHALRMTPFSS